MNNILFVNLGIFKWKLFSDERYLYLELFSGRNKSKIQHLISDLSGSASLSKFDNYQLRKTIIFGVLNTILFCVMALFLGDALLYVIASLSYIYVLWKVIRYRRLLGDIKCVDIYNKDGNIALSFPVDSEPKTQEFLASLKITIG